jgi:tetratricopeptide (TPR) repeat protein
MKRLQKSFAFFLRTLFAGLLCNLALGLYAGAWAADSARPQVGKPLQAAQALMKEQKYKEALEKIGEADAVSNKTPYETTMIARMRIAAASGAGDMDTAAKAFDTLVAGKSLSAQDEQVMMRALAGGYYRAKDYAKAESWAQRYQQAGGTDPAIGLLLVQADYQSGNYAGAAKQMQDIVAAQEKAGKAPGQDQLDLLRACYLKLNDNVAYTATLEKLVAYYPRKDYWSELLARVQRKPGFSDRLGLDVYRLMLLTGTLGTANDYMDMAELSLQAGYPKEAQKVIDQGYAGKVLGNGADADRQKRLKAMADKQNADDEKALGAEVPKSADAFVNTGYNLVMHGQNDKGLGMMQKGIAASDIKHPDEARLHLAEAYLLVGRKEEALKTLKAVQGKDGSQDLARLYTLAVQAGK